MIETSPVGFIAPKPAIFRNHLCVLPCGGVTEEAPQNWTVPELERYVSYYSNGKPVDKLFGGFIFNGVSVQPNRYMYPMYVGFGEAADIDDWSKWLEMLFSPGKNLKALYLLATQSPSVDVWVSIPYPYINQTNFGSVHGKSLNFKADDHDRFKAVAWWIDEFIERWKKEVLLHKRLSFRGFLWQRESIHDYDENLVIRTTQYIRDKGYFSLWLLNYGSYGCIDWQKFGFDIAVANPNYYGNAHYDVQWINNTSGYAKHYHTGLQIIYGKGLIFNETHFVDYLNLGLPYYNNYMTESFLVYQFVGQTLREICEQSPENYDRLYSFIKGTYVKTFYPGITY
ncbi:DUF4855 domain-containing protein [Aneurinibacillus terranovensis]|uniref:DUF4855 domain-containing protein n=1 Tax=Aneurinibacillus terranovensis TaxID=278991 RepID=UPI0004123C5F|nr:DUF4855 domain-containing protein [Aneurinibacillus terranovensis]